MNTEKTIQDLKAEVARTKAEWETANAALVETGGRKKKPDESWEELAIARLGAGLANESAGVDHDKALRALANAERAGVDRRAQELRAASARQACFAAMAEPIRMLVEADALRCSAMLSLEQIVVANERRREELTMISADVPPPTRAAHALAFAQLAISKAARVDPLIQRAPLPTPIADEDELARSIAQRFDLALDYDAVRDATMLSLEQIERALVGEDVAAEIARRRARGPVSAGADAVVSYVKKAMGQ